MTTTTEKVVVQYQFHGISQEWREVTLAEAREILTRKMRAGCSWVVPAWQFDEDGSTPEVVKQERAQEVTRAIFAE